MLYLVRYLVSFKLDHKHFIWNDVPSSLSTLESSPALSLGHYSVQTWSQRIPFVSVDSNPPVLSNALHRTPCLRVRYVSLRYHTIQYRRHTSLILLASSVITSVRSRNMYGLKAQSWCNPISTQSHLSPLPIVPLPHCLHVLSQLTFQAHFVPLRISKHPLRTQSYAF